MTDCLICNKHRDRASASIVVYSDDHWIVSHSKETNILGYFFVESRRHFLDMSDANDDEIASFAPLLKKLMQAMRETVDCHRIYIFCLGEAARPRN